MNDFKNAAQMSAPVNRDNLADRYDRLAREYTDAERSVQEGFDSLQAGEITNEDFERLMENHADVTRRANDALKSLRKEAASHANTDTEKQKLYEKFSRALTHGAEPHKEPDTKPEKDSCGNDVDEETGLPKVDWKAHKDFFR